MEKFNEAELWELIKNETGFIRQDILTKGRRKEMVRARALFSIFCRRAGLSYPKIAQFLGRDHTTIIHMVRKFEQDQWVFEMLEKHKDFSAFISQEHVFQLHKYRYQKYQSVLEKFNGKCHVCGFSDIVQICHIIPRSMGGGDSEENLIVLCPNHHELFDRGLLYIKDINNIPVR